MSKSNNGQSLIELLMAIALGSLLIPALLTSLLASREGRAQQEQRVQATALLQEAQEATRFVKELDWSNLAQNGTFHPTVSENIWQLSISQESIGGFTRKVVISDTYRDAEGKIAATGTLDPSTKKVTTTVSWGTPFATSVSSVSYLTRYTQLLYTETTEDQFNAGTKNKVVVTNTAGGEVILGAGGKGDWCAPKLEIPAVDLPKQGVANAVSTIVGKVAAGTGENASGVSFASVNISNTDPPEGTIDGTFDGYKTNGVFTEENYAYLATDNNFKEIVIIDLTQKNAEGKYLEAGYFDAPGNVNGHSIYVSGNIGFATAGSKLYTFNLTSKSGPRDQLGSVDLAGAGKKVVVNGNYAYVAVDSDQTQLQIIEISPDAKTLSVVGQARLNAEEGKDVAINSSATRAYVATDEDDDEKEFFIVNIETKTGDRPSLGSYDTSGMDPKAVALATNNKAVIVGTGQEEYQAVDIGNESSPSRCGGISIDTGVNGVATVLEPDGDAWAYIITGDANNELKIIAGGPGGKYSNTGTFESQIFDATNSAAFNKFEATANKPSSTDITFQVAVGNPPQGQNCESVSFTFIGPNGTSDTQFATGSAIPFKAALGGFENPGRCLRYKSYLKTSDLSQTPTLFDITFNYSP